MKYDTLRTESIDLKYKYEIDKAFVTQQMLFLFLLEAHGKVLYDR